MSNLDKFVKILFTILFFVETNNCDSLNYLPRYRRQTATAQNVSCQLPPHPPRGEWTLHGSQQLPPGDSVPSASILVFKCNKGYIFKGADIIVCLNDGSWSNSVGVCEQLCPTLTNTTSTTVTCQKESAAIVDCAHPDEGTLAEFHCKPFYENRESKPRVRVCHEGSWDQPPQTCEPVCGLKIARPQSLLAAADNNAIEAGDYPWHVGLYKNTVDTPKYLCGGSLISQNVILTAAHCVTDVQNGALLPKDSFSIAAGKVYSKYDDPRDAAVQYRKVKQIHLMPSWRGAALLYQADIAILITDEILQLSRRVQPVCMDYDGTVTQLVLQNPSPIGIVVGWGGDSEAVRDIALPYIDYDKCQQQLPEDFQNYLIQDRFCTGYANGGTPLCCGVSGNGFVFRNPKDNRFYLTGILGLSPTADSSKNHDNNDKNQYILLTNVTQYARNIIEKVASHRIPV